MSISIYGTRKPISSIVLAFLINLMFSNAVYAWEEDEHFTNVPFFHGLPMLAQKRPMMFAPANQVEYRIISRGFFSTTIPRNDIDERVTKILAAFQGPLKVFSGIRDERYFLISINPNIVIIAPFKFDLNYKTGKELSDLNLRGRITYEVVIPMHEQLQSQKKMDSNKEIANGYRAKLPNLNYVEIGCAFPDIDGAMLWAPDLMKQPVNFDLNSRIQLKEKLGISVIKHPRVKNYLHVEGCPT